TRNWPQPRGSHHESDQTDATEFPHRSRPDDRGRVALRHHATLRAEPTRGRYPASTRYRARTPTPRDPDGHTTQRAQAAGRRDALDPSRAGNALDPRWRTARWTVSRPCHLLRRDA